MPAKIDTELNLRFLYICFKHSNFSTVDFHEVASYFQIKAPAARMRLMRLRQALEAESSKEGFKEKDRKRRLNPFKAKDKMYAYDGEDDDDDESLDDVPLMQRFHARMMRIKREEGLMIKNEDGTLIKDEGTATIKNAGYDFWVKKEECADEQEEDAMVNTETHEVGGISHFKNEMKDSHPDLQKRHTSVDMEGVVKSEAASLGFVPSSYPSSNKGATMAKPQNVPQLNIPHRAAHLGPAQMERDYGYGGDQHTPAHPANAVPFNFRTYGHANTSSPYVHEHSDINKPEHTSNSGHPAPFHGYSSALRPDAFSTFAQVKPESTYGMTPSGLDSPFRLDMFNTAMTNSASEAEASPRQKSLVDSPMIQDGVHF